MVTGNNGNRLTVRRGRGGKLVSLYGTSVDGIFAGQSQIGPALQVETEILIRERARTTPGNRASLLIGCGRYGGLGLNRTRRFKGSGESKESSRGP